MYDSVAESNSGARANKKSREEPSPFALQTFDAFEPFINVFDCGIKYLDRPIHLITKEDWKLYGLHKAGEKPCYPDGTRFKPYRDVLSCIFSPEYVQHHITDNETTYYTSGRRGLGLLYLDIDAHHRWQTDELQARNILERLFPTGYYRPSGRGQNGYLKIRYSSITEFNETADKLQATLVRMFLHCGILCDIEVKGTITHDGKSGRLAKLPFTNKRIKQDDSDCWGHQQLERFIACPVVNARSVAEVAQMIEAKIDEDRVSVCVGRKQEFIRRDKDRDELVAKLRNRGWSGADLDILKRYKKLRDERVAAGLPVVTIPVLKTNTPQSDKPSSKTPQKIAAPTEAGRCGGDAFTRNQNDLLPFVRQFYKRHRQFPEVEDALLHLRDNGLFSGRWEDNEDRRAKRVGQILAVIEPDFDPKLLSNGESQPVDLRVGKFSWWVRQRYGEGIRAKTFDLRRFDPVTLTAPAVEAFVPAQFIETFLVVADFCLNQDPLENKAVPTSRIRMLWGMVVGGAAWNQKYFQIVRDRLDKAGVLRIFDRNHQTGKAWRWEAGSNFPSESWQAEQRKLKEQCKTLKIGKTCEEFLGDKQLLLNNTQHNTLYKNSAGILESSAPKPTSRPPPDG